MAQPLQALLAALLISASCVAQPARASTDAPPSSVEDSVRIGQSVVAGFFTGRSSTEVWEYDGLYDDAGQPIDYEEVVTVYAFEVTEQIAGDAVPRRIELNTIGGSARGLVTPTALQVPPARARVVLSLQKEPRRDGYIIVDARTFAAESDGELATLRAWVRALRDPTASSAPDAYVPSAPELPMDSESPQPPTASVANAGAPPPPTPRAEPRPSVGSPGLLAWGMGGATLIGALLLGRRRSVHRG